ncbi:hypothetical protein EIN_183860 [Entamoeba invadens IP1]|uniref:hypothetical protein n=1 Tax=Entamoeba invadens IP1 TaxID=370355 RepID=UPI0002C3F404|nr:hypothetical protein EIN_183860 [Entamoeba invadens IP1]ELP94069.1 hypothetical protein EIN_183860 [Entamoeba invadens IP1]|eukprot:XP_004260840.1 hypothetical protein EIN_183860 [Entamoeba invadens IP1]
MSSTTGIQLIDESIPCFEKWTSVHGKVVLLYDSKKDEGSNKTFNTSVMHKTNVFIINIDENGHFFGVFVKKPMTLDNGFNEDRDHFIFALNGEGRKSPEMWRMKTTEFGGIKLIRDDDILYEVGTCDGSFEIYKIGIKESKCNMLGMVYNGMSDKDLNGTNWIRKQKFAVSRVIALQISTD